MRIWKAMLLGCCLVPAVLAQSERETCITGFEVPDRRANLGEMHYSARVGGTTGEQGQVFNAPFLSEGSRLTTLQVNLGDAPLRLVQAFWFEVTLPDGTTRTLTCGNTDGTWTEPFEVPEDVHLVGISGRSGWYLDSLRFHFSDGQQTPLYGGPGGDTAFELILHRREGRYMGVLRGLWGTFDTAIESLGLVFMPVE